MAVFNNNRTFSTAIDFSAPDQWFMAPHTIDGPINFTINPIGFETSASVYVRLTADGVNEPTFTGMIERGDSEPFLNVAGEVNVVEFFYDGVDVWYTISNAREPLYTAAATTSDEMRPVVRHSGNITADETWAAEAVHVIEGDLVIASGVSINIEYGALVVAPVLTGLTTTITAA